MKWICKLLGHKRPYLMSRDRLRYICKRCGYTTFSIHAVDKYLKDAILGGRGELIESILAPSLIYKALKIWIKENKDDKSP